MSGGETFDAGDLPEDYQSFMGEVKDEISSIFSKQHLVGPQTFGEEVEAFLHAINWEEPFILSLLAFHLVTLLFVILSRKYLTVQTTLFLFLCTMVLASESINNHLQVHFHEYQISQNYFDKQGVFMLFFYSGPLLFILMLQLVLLLVHAAHLVVEVKKHQFKEEGKKKRRKEEEEKEEKEEKEEEKKKNKKE